MIAKGGFPMSKKRRRFTAEFKARVALDALSGENTLSELVSKYGVHTNQISQWKKQAKEQIVAGFSSKAEKSQQSDEARIKDLVPRRLMWISHEASSSLMGAPIR
jgi:transposase